MTSFQNITIEVGKDAVLRISVNSNPPSHINWEFEGESVLEPDSGNDRSIEQLLDGSLMIKNVALTDTGNWTVIANNEIDNNEFVQKNIFLEVTPARTNITVRKFILSNLTSDIFEF